MSLLQLLWAHTDVTSSGTAGLPLVDCFTKSRGNIVSGFNAERLFYTVHPSHVSQLMNTSKSQTKK